MRKKRRGRRRRRRKEGQDMAYSSAPQYLCVLRAIISGWKYKSAEYIASQRITARIQKIAEWWRCRRRRILRADEVNTNNPTTLVLRFSLSFSFTLLFVSSALSLTLRLGFRWNQFQNRNEEISKTSYPAINLSREKSDAKNFACEKIKNKICPSIITFEKKTQLCQIFFSHNTTFIKSAISTSELLFNPMRENGNSSRFRTEKGETLDYVWRRSKLTSKSASIFASSSRQP